jgi:hypothetical protein
MSPWPWIGRKNSPRSVSSRLRIDTRRSFARPMARSSPHWLSGIPGCSQGRVAYHFRHDGAGSYFAVRPLATDSIDMTLERFSYPPRRPMTAWRSRKARRRAKGCYSFRAIATIARIYKGCLALAGTTGSPPSPLPRRECFCDGSESVRVEEPPCDSTNESSPALP